MSTPILVGIVDPSRPWRDTARVLKSEANVDRVDVWLILVGSGATHEAKAACARILDVPEQRVVLAGKERPPDPEADPAHLAAYLRDTFVRITRGRPVQLLADPGRPRTFAMLSELATVLRNFSLRLPGVGVVRREIDPARRLAEALPDPGSSDTLLGHCAAMDRVRAQVERYGPLPWPVLVLGETGTGKELVAKELHRASARTGRLVSVNAARLIDDRAAESELFGHVKGAYTGAEAARDGRFNEATGGTLFLDEFPNLTPNLQGRLLRALNKVDEAKVWVYPMGGKETDERPLPVRFIAAAQHDPRLASAVVGTHPVRDDLYWRIATLVIRIPPLRDRGEDVLLLAEHALTDVASTAKRALSFDADAKRFLRQHPWPGNIRELATVLRRAWVLLETEESVISREHLMASVDALGEAEFRIALPCNLRQQLGRLGRQAIEDALAETDDNLTKAASLLGFKRDLGRKLETYSNWERNDANDD